ncbi:MAG TPA: hypothetical protein VIL37_11050 [Natronosporangium sp.]
MASHSFAGSSIGLARPDRVLVWLGAGCVVLGGLVAAVTRPLQLTDGSWAAAYLVLVCGVAQYVMGRVLGLPAVPGKPGWSLVAVWNLGNLAVIAGTLLEVPAIVDAGAVLLVAALGLAWLAGRAVPRPVGWLYRGMLLVLLVSIPVGVVLAHLRAG